MGELYDVINECVAMVMTGYQDNEMWSKEH